MLNYFLPKVSVKIASVWETTHVINILGLIGDSGTVGIPNFCMHLDDWWTLLKGT